MTKDESTECPAQTASGKASPSITIVIPCLNEEANVLTAINATLAALDHYRLDGELIVINDGSSDGTAAIVKKRALIDARIRLINHDRPLGIGRSFFDGVRNASKEFVTLFPGDNENDPDDALTYIQLAKDVDIIIPFIHNAEIRPIMRRVISSLYRFIINLSFGTNFNYTNGTVIYNTAVLRGVVAHSRGFLYQAEILVQLVREGYLYAETPHFLTERNYGKTKALTLKSLGEVTVGYLRLLADVHILRRVGITNQPLHKDSATYRRVLAAKEKRDSSLPAVINSENHD